MSTSFTEDPLNTRTDSPLHITAPQYYKLEVSPPSNLSISSTSTAAHYPHVLVYDTNSAQSSPQITKRILNYATAHHSHVPTN